MASDDVVRMLGAVPLFSGLSKRELASLARAAKSVRHDAGATLAREGDRGLGFFLITDGTAKVVVGGRTRRKLGPGDWFGEISLIDEGPRTATVAAETPIEMLGITSWVFKRLVEQNPSVAMKMLRVMAGRLRTAAEEPTH